MEEERELKRRADPSSIPQKGAKSKTLQEYLNGMVYSGDVDQ